MKTITKLWLAVGFVSTALAQGTIEFRTTLEPVPGLDWLNEPTRGYFSLTGKILNGTATYLYPEDTTFIRLENAAHTSLFEPNSIVGLAPIPGYLATWTDIQLTDTEVSELIQGTWRVTVGGGSYPNGALVGQLQAVPEPTMWALIAVGTAFIAARRFPKDQLKKSNIFI